MPDEFYFNVAICDSSGITLEEFLEFRELVQGSPTA